MHLALTQCPDCLIRTLASSLPAPEITLGALPPGHPRENGGDTDGIDAILTAPCDGSGDCDHVRCLRRNYRDVPILVVTGTDDPGLAVRAFDAGADVVLKGPLHPAELRLRLRALTRATADGVFHYGPLRLNRLRHAAEGPDGSAHLTPREYQILQYLMRRAEKVVSRTELAGAVWWDEDEPPSGNLLDVHLSHVRSKLEDIGAHGLVHTVRGVGFIFGSSQLAGDTPGHPA